MKRLLLLVLISFCCVAEENRLEYFTESAESIEFLDTEYRGRSLEERCGDFTELVGNDWQSRTFTVVNRIDKGKAIVIVIQDSAGPLYCIKQIRADAHAKRGYEGYLEGHVRDVVASYVFESMGIRNNKVRIIPAVVNFPGKHYPDRLASLHTFVPGTNKSHAFPFNLRLAQYLKSRKAVRERGLTLQIINGMSQHDDLPPIVAGDTFTSNPDRSGNNLFWDERTGRFCGIDLELAFKLPLSRNLSEVAYYQIEKFFKTPGFSLNKQQYRAIEQYNLVLQGLIENNHPVDTCQLFKNVAAYARIVFVRKGDFIQSGHNLQDYYEKINAQYNSSKKLVKQIDTLLQSLRYLKRRIRHH